MHAVRAHGRHAHLLKHFVFQTFRDRVKHLCVPAKKHIKISHLSLKTSQLHSFPLCIRSRKWMNLTLKIYFHLPHGDFAVSS